MKSLKALSRRYSSPVYISKTVGFYLGLSDDPRCMELRHGRKIRLDGLSVTPFIVSHDAMEPFGFIIEGGGASIGLATDLGSAEGDVVEILSNNDALVIESNYDMDMLLRGPYQFKLKKRIMNIKGHLSNLQCRDLLMKTVGDRTRQIVLAHLSEENNDPLLALECSMAAVKDRELVKIRLSYPRTPTPYIPL